MPQSKEANILMRGMMLDAFNARAKSRQQYMDSLVNQAVEGMPIETAHVSPPTMIHEDDQELQPNVRLLADPSNLDETERDFEDIKEEQQNPKRTIIRPPGMDDSLALKLGIAGGSHVPTEMASPPISTVVNKVDANRKSNNPPVESTIKTPTVLGVAEASRQSMLNGKTAAVGTRPLKPMPAVPLMPSHAKSTPLQAIVKPSINLQAGSGQNGLGGGTMPATGPVQANTVVPGAGTTVKGEQEKLAKGFLGAATIYGSGALDRGTKRIARKPRNTKKETPKFEPKPSLYVPDNTSMEDIISNDKKKRTKRADFSSMGDPTNLSAPVKDVVRTNTLKSETPDSVIPDITLPPVKKQRLPAMQAPAIDDEKIASVYHVSPFCAGFLKRASEAAISEQDIQQAIVNSMHVDPFIRAEWEKLANSNHIKEAGIFSWLMRLIGRGAKAAPKITPPVNPMVASTRAATEAAKNPGWISGLLSPQNVTLGAGLLGVPLAMGAYERYLPSKDAVEAAKVEDAIRKNNLAASQYQNSLSAPLDLESTGVYPKVYESVLANSPGMDPTEAAAVSKRLTHALLTGEVEGSKFYDMRSDPNNINSQRISEYQAHVGKNPSYSANYNTYQDTVNGMNTTSTAGGTVANQKVDPVSGSENKSAPTDNPYVEGGGATPKPTTPTGLQGKGFGSPEGQASTGKQPATTTGSIFNLNNAAMLGGAGLGAYGLASAYDPGVDERGRKKSRLPGLLMGGAGLGLGAYGLAGGFGKASQLGNPPNQGLNPFTETKLPPVSPLTPPPAATPPGVTPNTPVTPGAAAGKPPAPTTPPAAGKPPAPTTTGGKPLAAPSGGNPVQQSSWFDPLTNLAESAGIGPLLNTGKGLAKNLYNQAAVTEARNQMSNFKPPESGIMPAIGRWWNSADWGQRASAIGGLGLLGAGAYGLASKTMGGRRRRDDDEEDGGISDYLLPLLMGAGGAALGSYGLTGNFNPINSKLFSPSQWIGQPGHTMNDPITRADGDGNQIPLDPGLAPEAANSPELVQAHYNQVADSLSEQAPLSSIMQDVQTGGVEGQQKLVQTIASIGKLPEEAQIRYFTKQLAQSPEGLAIVGAIGSPGNEQVQAQLMQLAQGVGLPPEQMDSLIQSAGKAWQLGQQRNFQPVPAAEGAGN